MMDKRLTVIYADAAEKFVKNVVLYGGFTSGEAKSPSLYYDAERTQLVNGKDLVNLCQKGLIVDGSDERGFYQETVCAWYVGPDQNSDNQELICVTVSTCNCNFFNPIVNEEEAESEEEEAE